jgi:RimJ/RimL family protein N-acetyltransferase
VLYEHRRRSGRAGCVHSDLPTVRASQNHQRTVAPSWQDRRTFPDAIVRTERLILRPFRESDIDAVQAGGADPLTQTWLPLPNPYTRELAAGWCREGAAARRTAGDALVRAIEFDGEPAGCIDLKHTDWAARASEIGYWTVSGARDKGVMAEAVAGLAQSVA